MTTDGWGTRNAAAPAPAPAPVDDTLGTPPEPEPPTGSRSTGSGFEDSAWDRTRRWRPTRRGVAVAALLLVALVVLMLTGSRRAGYLDPAAVDPSGSRAVATILGDLGIRVSDVRTTADVASNATGSTVLITDSTLPTAAMIDSVLDAGPARVILVDPFPGTPAFERLAAGTELADLAEGDPVAPGCQLAVAVRAGGASLPGTRYDARSWSDSAQACYDDPESAAVLAIPARAGRPEVVLLGSAHPLTNDGLDEQGNAALALGLLGERDDLVWWRPSPNDPALATEAGASVTDLVPAWVIPVLIQILVACLLVVWWRSRRLGRLVVEPLPVVVRAGETTAGHARLLHSHHARAEAAVHLRARARERIRVRLGLPQAVPPERLVAAVATRSGQSTDDVGRLLYGPDPTTDTDLVALGHDLDELMREVGGA